MKPILFHNDVAALLAVMTYGSVVASELSLAVRTWRAGHAGANRGAHWGLVLASVLGVYVAWSILRSGKP